MSLIRTLSLLPLIMHLTVFDAFADGPYDGVWIGTESATVPGVGSDSGETFSIFFQDGPNTLYAARQDFDDFDQLTAMQLVRQGGTWVLSSPIADTVFGIDVVVTSFSVSFSGDSRLNGSYAFRFSAGDTTYNGTGSLAHSKQTCTSSGNGPTTIPGLSGGAGTLKCYQLQLPACATNFEIRTSGGFGDADLHVAYGEPDFDYYYSSNEDNNEAILPFARSGVWYVGVEGFSSFNSVTLQIAYTVSDTDSDGVPDCVDLCPNTPSGESVDSSGCAYSQRDDDSDGVLNDVDNCPTTANADQADNDTDGAGDLCDSDDDNDGLTDEMETNQYRTDPLRADTDRDGVSDGDEVAAGTDPLVNVSAVITIINTIMLGD